MFFCTSQTFECSPQFTLSLLAAACRAAGAEMFCRNTSELILMAVKSYLLKIKQFQIQWHSVAFQPLFFSLYPVVKQMQNCFLYCLLWRQTSSQVSVGRRF